MPEESTTLDRVDVVTGLFEAADRGDWDAVLRLFAPDAIWSRQTASPIPRAAPVTTAT